MLLLHILIAITSLIVTAVLYFSPSKAKLTTSYIFVALTILTGTILILTQPVHMLQTCVTGMTFIGISLLGIILSKHTLAKKKF